MCSWLEGSISGIVERIPTFRHSPSSGNCRLIADLLPHNFRSHRFAGLMEEVSQKATKERPFPTPSGVAYIKEARGNVPGNGAARQLQRKLGSPIHLQTTMMLRAILKVEIHQALIWQSRSSGKPPKILNGRRIKPDGNLPLEGTRIRIPLGFGEVVFFSH